MSNASCSVCEREPVQLLEGHFSNGRKVEERRCQRHSEDGSAIGNRVIRGKGPSRFQIDSIRRLDSNEGIAPAAADIVQPNGVHVLDAARRTYMALSRDRSYWHLIYPAQPWEWVVQQGKRPAGALICTCEGGRMHGYCYRVEQAERLEADADPWAVPARVAVAS